MSISASNVAPDFIARRQITAQDLRRLDEPAVIFEYHGIDSDEAHFYVYTIAGYLDGENIATIQGGATVGGDVIVIHADNRESADALACLGLEETINAMDAEEDKHLDALAAQARLASVSPMERLEQSMKAEKNPDFVDDIDKVRTLVGDDIVLATGH